MKLHGGFDIAYCPSHNPTKFIMPPEPRYENHLFHQSILRCGINGCQGELERFIIPPISNKYKEFILKKDKKELKDSIFAKEWAMALKGLTNANEIVIIGYSFPEIDFLVKILLMKSIFRNKNLQRVTIVNPSLENDCYKNKVKKTLDLKKDKLNFISKSYVEYMKEEIYRKT